HGWERRQVLVVPTKPVRSVNIYALFRNHTGTAWFDDFSLAQLSSSAGAAFFDGVPVKAGRIPIIPTAEPTISIGRSFRLQLGERDGLPYGWEYRGSRVEVPEAARDAGGFFLRDAAADSDFYGFRAPLSKMPRAPRASRPAPSSSVPHRTHSHTHTFTHSPSSILRTPSSVRAFSQDGAILPLQLKLRANYRDRGDRVEISGQVIDTSARDRSITLYYALPLPPNGLKWWDTLRVSRPTKPGGVYASTVGIGAGTSGQISRIPFSCLASKRIGLSYNLPMNSPRVARIVYDAGAGQYYVAFDFGIVRGGPPATFQFAITAEEPQWGLRAAAQHYYNSFPAFFQKRVKRQGIWMPFSPISQVEHPDDFGFGFKEGNAETAWDDAHGVATFRYTEPMSWWMTIPPGVKRDYKVAIDYMNRYATGAIGSADTREYARATKISGDFTDDGLYHVNIVDAPWAHGALFIDNCNPRIPDTPDNPNRAHVAWTAKIEHSLYDSTLHGTQDGEYLDSLEGWGDLKNYRRRQFPYETESLTFDTETEKPCILQAVSTFEFTRWMAAAVHHRGKLMFANATPWRFFWFAPLLDVMGTETQWIINGKYHPEADDIMLYRRLICYQKPYLLLMNVDFDQFNHAMVEKYFQRSLFYGIFPSMFSHNAADNPYWGNPKWYNRDRNLFRKYIPVIRDLAEAGWDPITGARTGNPNLWVERFGSGAKMAFSVFNNASTVHDVILTFSSRDLPGRLPTGFTDRLTGRRYPIRIENGHPAVHLTLAPQNVAALFGE
ncbi:MAG TPA: hypothetical protein VFJ58_05470, partial [Armatimonadota bacterium]|nr:hypothetical protein [Armatimonadota bacterium]